MEKNQGAIKSAKGKEAAEKQKAMISGVVTAVEIAHLKKAINGGYETAMRAATIYETAIAEIGKAHASDSVIKTPADLKKMILAAARKSLAIKNEKEETPEAAKYRAFARFCNQSFNWQENRKMTAIEFKEAKKPKAPGAEPAEKKKETVKDNKKQMSRDELRKMIAKGDQKVNDAILDLFPVDYIHGYLNRKLAAETEKRKTITPK